MFCVKGFGFNEKEEGCEGRLAPSRLFGVAILFKKISTDSEVKTSWQDEGTWGAREQHCVTEVHMAGWATTTPLPPCRDLMTVHKVAGSKGKTVHTFSSPFVRRSTS